MIAVDVDPAENQEVARLGSRGLPLGDAPLYFVGRCHRPPRCSAADCVGAWIEKSCVELAEMDSIMEADN